MKTLEYKFDYEKAIIQMDSPHVKQFVIPFCDSDGEFQTHITVHRDSYSINNIRFTNEKHDISSFEIVSADEIDSRGYMSIVFPTEVDGVPVTSRWGSIVTQTGMYQEYRHAYFTRETLLLF